MEYTVSKINGINIYPRTNEEDPLTQHVNEIVAIIRFDGVLSPIVGELQREENGYKIRVIPTPKIPADCPQPQIEFEVEHFGRSGIGSRNSWISKVKTERKTIPSLVLKEGEWNIYVLDYRDIDVPNEEEAKRAQDALDRWRDEYFERKCIEKIDQLLGNYDAVVIKEFNKKPFFGIAPDGFLVSLVKRTCRLNATVVLIRDKETLKVPNHLKGLVIGKGGKRIRELEKKAGHRIRVI